MTSIFHRFIEVAASKHPQASSFPEFAYMQHDIRKSYKQLKDNKGVPKPCDDFIDYWKEVGKEGKEEQVAMYFRWIQLLERAKKGQQIRELVDREAQMYVKKSLIGKWQRRKVRLTGLTMQIFSKNLRQYPLRCFCIRKSKKKEHFSLVMEIVMQLDQSKYKSFHIGTNNIIEFQEWYRDVESRIEIARVQYFIEVIGCNRENSGKKDTDKIEKIEPVFDERLNSNDNRVRTRTITQMVIDKELKQIEEGEELEVIEESQTVEVREEETHPNIFHRLFPSYDLDNFTENPVNGELLEIDKHHRLYQFNGKLKIFLTINHNISSVFRAISESHKYWNPDIDVFAIKNKISSENSVLAYQKDKSRGFLYRQRDYLFLRHCFTTQFENERTKIFMIQKSIDSIHTPPFMTVARGDKELIWCIIGESDQRQCLLIVEGLIKGGGYMNSNQDKETTIRHFKKLLQLENYLKQAQFTKNNQQGLLFRQHWTVSIKEESQEQFYSPKEFIGNQEETNQANIEREGLQFKKQKQQEQFNEFIKHTTEQNLEQCIETDRTVNFSNQQFRLEYKPPEIASDRSVILPTNYLKARHRINPKSKDKDRLAEIIRGHHLWKGQWAVNEAGGLNYVDEEKMRQQKKVLTFIIKRIGKSILSGKGILNISLPVDIFCRQSNIQRAAMSFGFCPMFLEKVARADDPIEQLKGIISVCMGSSLIYLTMQKPFNPILGETYQSWIDGCPVYFQQISHHPPIAAYYMIGRGYTISGSMQAKMDISINSGTGINEGIYTVKFDNGRTFYFVTPPGQISGLTYGERKLCLVRQTYFWNIQEGIFLEVSYNPLSKQRGFFGGGGKSLVGQQRLADYFEGTVRRYKPEDLREFLTPKKSDSRKIMSIPRGSPNYPILSQAEKIHGRWTKYVFYGDEKLFDADRDRHSACIDDKNPLPSHSNFREDVVYRRLNNFVLSQEFKEILQVKQRKDRKLREEYKKKNR